MSDSEKTVGVAIVGAGLAGLRAATYLSTRRAIRDSFREIERSRRSGAYPDRGRVLLQPRSPCAVSIRVRDSDPARARCRVQPEGRTDVLALNFASKMS